MDKQKDYVVFNQTMAAFMMMNGCRLLNVKPNKNKPTMNVYYFPDTEYVKSYAQEYIDNQHN